MATSLALLVGRRYASLRSRSQLVGFISTLSILGLALGVATLIMVLSVINGFDRELQQRILGLVPHISIGVQRNTQLLNEEEWQQYQQIVENRAGVIATVPHVQLQGMLISNGNNRGIVVNGIDPEQEGNVSIMADFITEGSFNSLQGGDYHILLGEKVAEYLQLEIGDKVTLVSTVIPISPMGEIPRKKNFTLTGIFKVGSQLDNNLALIHRSDAQRLYRLGDNVHGVRVKVEDVFSVTQIIQGLRFELPANFSYSSWTREYGPMFENIKLSKTLVGLLLFLLVAIATFNVVVSLIMVVKDKQGDIAILRTMGTPIKSIRHIFLIQGLFIGLLGTGLGLFFGLIFSLTVTDFVAWLEILFQVSFVSEEVYPVNYLPSDIQFKDVALVCCVSMLLSLIATLYPAYTAAKVDPAVALRYE